MAIKKLYIFDEANLQTVIDFTGVDPKIILDWSEEISKISLLISSKALRLETFVGKPVFKFMKDMAILVGKYTIVALIEGEDKETIKKKLLTIYRNLIRESPILANEVAEIVLESLK